MTDIKELLQVFHKKLKYTGSLDAAFLKSVWVAYNEGLKDGILYNEQQHNQQQQQKRPVL